MAAADENTRAGATGGGAAESTRAGVAGGGAAENTRAGAAGGGVAVEPAGLDLSLASLFAGWALADELQRRLAAEGLDDLRFADGFVFQHLVGGPVTVGLLAERLEVTQQAASKAVADLERRGYVTREPDPQDARARLVTLTARGREAIEGGRRHRAEIDAELAERLGPRRVESARRVLTETLAALGVEAAVRRRRVRAPR